MNNVFLILVLKNCNVNSHNLKQNSKIATYSIEDERLQRLHNSAAEGNVDALFSILAEDPYVLERIDEIPFVTTPLHTAASWGKVHFMLEIVNLKPSFASKQDHLGRSPLHLALERKKLQEGRSPPDLDLEGKYQEVVRWLINYDSQLVRVRAKGWITPLHYALRSSNRQ
ncbi:hypothetical protein Patl1_19428 [Pistacia atlantica]|uniref:Uncharacterized protein n=1 Tax=Pistacia atlantica TaxID=434234 RepID=A0ACC1C2K2_9ROSI|nr:hypothetical protein Patl1_19428 [Pistacia atlantica]